MSRLLKITDLGSGILVQGTDNVLYPDNATLTYPYNSIVVVTDESDIATFRSASNNDVLFSGLIGNIEIGGETVTKQNINEKFDAIANQESGGGGDMSDYYTKEETNTLLEDKADIEDIPTDVSELQNDAGYITQAEVVVNESFPSAWMQALDMEDLITAINNDSDAVVGKCYMDTISLSDLPDNMQQADVKAEIMSELQGTGKVILFTVTSSNQAPYHWEYTSAYGETGTWREWLVASDIANFFDGAEYDSNTKRINFKHGNTVKTYIDATAFIKDGMVDSVTISNGNLVITFNTDAGKQPISIPLTDIFNPANYYDKTATDNLLAAKADAETTYTKTQVDTALAAKANASDVYNKTYIDTKEEVISTALNDLESTKLDASDAFSGSYNDLTDKPVIPAAQVNADWDAVSGVAQILNKPTIPDISNYYTKTESDNKYLTKTEFDTKEEVISTALNELDTNKQDVLTAGANITIDANNVISSTGGTQVQSDWNQSDSTAVDYIKNKPTIPDTSDFVTKTEYNPKEVAIANALTQLNDNKADSSDLASKQDTLVSGTNIKTINNESILGSGNITIQGGGTQQQADWNQSDSSAVDYIKNKPTIPTVPTDLSDFTNDVGYIEDGNFDIMRLELITQSDYDNLANNDDTDPNTLYIITSNV